MRYRRTVHVTVLIFIPQVPTGFKRNNIREVAGALVEKKIIKSKHVAPEQHVHSGVLKIKASSCQILDRNKRHLVSTSTSVRVKTFLSRANFKQTKYNMLFSNSERLFMTKI